MIKYYLGKSKTSTFLVILFAILQGLFGAGFAIVFEKFIDYAINIEKTSFAIKEFLLVALLLLVYILIYNLVDFLRRMFRANLIVQINKAVKTNYFSKLFSLDLVKYHEKDTGYYLSRFTQDLQTIINEYLIEFFNLLLYIFQSVFTIAVAFYINYLIAIVFLALSFLIIVYTMVFEKKFKKLREEASKRNAEYIIHLKSYLNGFDNIKLHKAEEVFLKKYETKLKPTNDTKRKWWILEAVYSPMNAFLTLSLTFVSIVFSTLFYIKGIFTIGLLTGAIYLSSQIFNPVANIFEQLTYLKANKDLAKVVFREISCDDASKLKLGEKIDTFKLERVSFKYENSEEYLLKDFNFEISKGKKYLIVGKSGAGKSTFLKLLIGKLNYEGSIKINSFELSEIDKSSLYSLVGYVSQTPFIFNDTILNNIDLVGKHALSEVEEVIRKVNLKEFVSQKGIDAYISEEIMEVSGGEKQRICLARTLLNKPEVLLLDEVTASLDKDTAFEIEKLVTTLDMTVLYVCHKVSEKILNVFDYLVEFTGNEVIVKELKK